MSWVIISIIGCGHIGAKRARILDNMGIQTVLYDRDFGRASNLAGVLNNSYVYNGVSFPQTDACFVCSPPESHVEIAIQAAEHVQDVFIEKPLALSLRDPNLKTLFETIQKKGVVAMMGQSYRHHPSLNEFRKQLDAQRKNPVVFASLSAGHYLPDWHAGENWRMSESARMGASLEMWAHSFDTANWLFGEINAVTALIGNSGELGIPGDDVATALLRVGHNDAHVVVHADYWRSEKEYRVSATLAVGDALEWQMESVDGMLEAETAHFIKAVQTRTQLQPDLAQGAKILEIIDCAKLAAQTGTWQKIPGEWKKLVGRI